MILGNIISSLKSCILNCVSFIISKRCLINLLIAFQFLFKLIFKKSWIKLLSGCHVYELIWILIVLKYLRNSLLLILYFILQILKLRVAIKCHWIFLMVKCFILTFLICRIFVIILYRVIILNKRQNLLYALIVL